MIYTVKITVSSKKQNTSNEGDWLTFLIRHKGPRHLCLKPFCDLSFGHQVSCIVQTL